MEDLLRRKGVLDRAHAAGLVTDSDYGIRLAALQADTADQLDAPAQAPAAASPAAPAAVAHTSIVGTPSAGGTMTTPGTAGSATGAASAKRRREDAALSVTLRTKRPKAVPLGQPGLGGFGFVLRG